MNADKGRRDIDGAAIGDDYRAGDLSLRQMACPSMAAHPAVTQQAAEEPQAAARLTSASRCFKSAPRPNAFRPSTSNARMVP